MLIVISEARFVNGRLAKAQIMLKGMDTDTDLIKDKVKYGEDGVLPAKKNLMEVIMIMDRENPKDMEMVLVKTKVIGKLRAIGKAQDQNGLVKEKLKILELLKEDGKVTLVNQFKLLQLTLIKELTVPIKHQLLVLSNLLIDSSISYPLSLIILISKLTINHFNDKIIKIK